jgi:hypothetical protein
MNISSINSDFNLTKYLRSLIFKDPNKYDAAIRGWIEKNRSKDWHLKWKNLLELPVLNEQEVIEPLKTTLRTDRYTSPKMEKINKIASLIDFLDFGGHYFNYRWRIYFE